MASSTLALGGIGGLLSYTCVTILDSDSFPGRIGAPRPGAGGEVTFSEGGLVCSIQ